MSEQRDPGGPATPHGGDRPPSTAVAVLCLALFLLSGYLLWSKATAEGGATPTGLTKPRGEAAAQGSNNTADSLGGPRLAVDRNRIDLGDVKLGSTVQAAFQLTDAGDRPLSIMEKPSVEVLEGC